MASYRRSSGIERNGGAPAAQAYDTVRRAHLAELQRARILSAMFEVACERGAGNVTVAHVVERSGVSRRTFYEVFDDREQCFLAAFEQALAYASERVLPAFESETGWRDRIRAGLIALLSFLDEQPLIGRVLLCESLAGGKLALGRRLQVVATLTQIVADGLGEGKGSSAPTPLLAEGVVGGVLAVISSRLTAPTGEPMVALANPLMSMIVLPYSGSAAARRELAKPVVTPEQRHEATLISDPFKDAGMRLTYRTVRVLLAVAGHADASNRQVGESAGIKDQGQISKLLGRLERIGLIENTGIYPGKGAPNSWALTQKGHQLTESVRAHTPPQVERPA